MKSTNWKNEAEKTTAKVRSKKLIPTVANSSHFYTFAFLFFMLTLFSIGVFMFVDGNEIVFKIGVNPKTTPTPTAVATLTPTPTVTPSESMVDITPQPTVAPYANDTFTNFSIKAQKDISGTIFAFVTISHDGYETLEFGTLSTVNGEQIFSYYTDKGQHVGQILASSYSPQMLDFWFEPLVDKLFVVSSLTDTSSANQGGMPQGIFMVSLPTVNSETPGTWSLIYSGSPGIYSRFGLMGFDRQTMSLIIDDAGGDSCASWGTISTLTLSGELTEVTRIAGGCGDSTKPRLLDYKNSTLYLATVSQEDTNSNPVGPSYPITEIYTLDAMSLEKTSLVTLNPTVDIIYDFSKDWLSQSDFTIADNEVTFKGTMNFAGTDEQYFALDTNALTFRSLGLVPLPE
ncbi:hypothetical protein CO180_02605 [candidate division WWE3 bacterium CG_4_9_14_3_um_filter_41_6]|uniref:Uncharacterized protein n=1 Tax=candidate division WWE3 bacterium CG_4_10_14_0_2_um_filter_41_14 TaxID=1975072 RepID=A0A2M7TIF4_UNCKA|nr:MAG: hypothetical protein COY32_04090 [candidate division WWE3 bacterium CG_4_10_14_0_2_um_filter_41_14]PJA38756.1 MAG: hypothetical protein CO180_02605 [candidate division WWE3 bacterium CG_4_9_14_3_um_filter_41_6]